jgi:hypothetical protein
MIYTGNEVRQKWRHLGSRREETLQTIVFIHGTGVREPAYTTSFNLVQQALNRSFGAPNVHLEPCYWGETCGSQLYLGGASIPEADTTRGIDGEGNEFDYHLALWGLVYDDPFAELQMDSRHSPAPGFQLVTHLCHRRRVFCCDARHTACLTIRWAVAWREGRS